MTLDDLVARARALSRTGRRTLLGITGAPGAGKSTIAAAVVAELGAAAVLVPMDGFHLADAALVRLGRRDRKGAPDTFDGDGFVHLLRRLQAADEAVVWAPEFRRDLEEPVAGAVGVSSAVPLVVVEGNYLLLDEDPWRQVKGLLDETWYVQPPEELRLERLVARHVAYGKEPEAARAWVLGSDQSNADLVAPTAARADLVIDLAAGAGAG